MTISITPITANGAIGLTAGLMAEPVANERLDILDTFEPHDGSLAHLVAVRSPLAHVQRFGSLPELQVHSQLEGKLHGAVFPLDQHYAPQFAERGGRIFDKELGTVFNVANVKKDGDLFAQDPTKVNTILIGLHGATHPEKSIGASLLNPFGTLKQQAKKIGISLLTVVPDLPLHGLGPQDARFINSLDFYVRWVARIVEKLQQTYPKAKIAIYGRSTGAVIGLELAIRKPGLIHSLFADSPYPPKTQEAQALAIAERERARKLAHPDAPDHVAVPFSEEMLINHDPDLKFWNATRSFGETQFLVRLGKHDDNYRKFPYTVMWEVWSGRTGIPVKIDEGEHNGLGGLQQKSNSTLAAVAQTNAGILMGMINSDLQNHLPWRIAQKQKRERALEIAKARLEKLQNLLKAKEALLARKQAAYARKPIPTLLDEVVIAEGKVRSIAADVAKTEKLVTHHSLGIVS